MSKDIKQLKRERRHRRIRAKVNGTAFCPRLSVFKSNRYLSAQLIDDDAGATLASATSKGMSETSVLLRAKKVGELVAARAKKKKLEKAVFDRGGYRYTGAVEALADGAREGGLKF